MNRILDENLFECPSDGAVKVQIIGIALMPPLKVHGYRYQHSDEILKLS